MKRLLAAGMERVCFLLDWPPIRRRLPWPLTKLACPNGLAAWSFRLDGR